MIALRFGFVNTTVDVSVTLPAVGTVVVVIGTVVVEVDGDDASVVTTVDSVIAELANDEAVAVEGWSITTGVSVTIVRSAAGTKKNIRIKNYLPFKASTRITAMIAQSTNRITKSAMMRQHIRRVQQRIRLSSYAFGMR